MENPQVEIQLNNHILLLLQNLELFCKNYQDYYIHQTWELFGAELLELENELTLGKSPITSTKETTKLYLSTERIDYLRGEIDKILEIIEKQKLPVLLKKFELKFSQPLRLLEEWESFDFSNADDLNSLTVQSFPIPTDDNLVFITQNANPVLPGLQALMIVDYNNPQVLPKYNEQFRKLLVKTCKDHLVMFNISQSNSISNLHAQVILNNPPLSEKEIQEKYPNKVIIFYDLKTEEGYKEFLEIWAKLNFKQVSSSAVLTTEGTAAIFVQEYDKKLITKTIDPRLDGVSKDKQILIRMLLSIIKIGGYEIYLWLKYRTIINKANLAPEGIMSDSLQETCMEFMLVPLTQEIVEILNAIPNKDILTLLDTEQHFENDEILIRIIQELQEHYFDY